MPFATIPEGEIHYIHQGEGKNFVVLPRFWTNSFWMSRYFELTDLGKVWIIDPPYSNLSTCPTRSNIDSYAKTVVATLRCLEIRNPVLIGESLGSATALATEEMQSFSRMILIAPTLGLNLGHLLEGYLLMSQPFERTVKKRAGKMFRRMPELIGPATEMMLGFGKFQLLGALRALREFEPKKYRPRCKTLIIGGKFDKIATPEVVRKCGELYGAKTVINENTGHHVSEHAWPDVLGQIRDFVGS